jgi:hypothetical protein
MSPDILKEVEKLIRHYRRKIVDDFIESNPDISIEDVTVDQDGELKIWWNKSWKSKYDFQEDQNLYDRLCQLEKDLNFE